METLSLTQPWATLVAIGAKKWETRSWSTKYRGPLLIHAAKKFTRDDRALIMEWPFSEYIKEGTPLPLGKILCRVDLVDVITTDGWMGRYSRSESESTQEEYRFGNYTHGRFAWELRNPVKFDKPIPAKGSLGLWEFEESALGHLAERSR